MKGCSNGLLLPLGDIKGLSMRIIKMNVIWVLTCRSWQQPSDLTRLFTSNCWRFALNKREMKKERKSWFHSRCFSVTKTAVWDSGMGSPAVQLTVLCLFSLTIPPSAVLCQFFLSDKNVQYSLTCSTCVFTDLTCCLVSSIFSLNLYETKKLNHENGLVCTQKLKIISTFLFVVPYLFILIVHNGANLIVLLSGESFWLLV